jgi:hypothetical protein
VEALRGGSGLRGVAALGLAGALVVAGCGSSHRSITNVTPTGVTTGQGNNEFTAPGMAIRFLYPARLHPVELAPSKRIVGNTGQASHAAVGTGPHDLLIVTRFPKRPIPVNSQNIARLKPQFDAAVSSALGRRLTSSVQTLRGLPALSYPAAPVVGLPIAATSRITNVFVRDDEYELNCQYTPKGAATITAACNEMLSTLSTRR